MRPGVVGVQADTPAKALLHGKQHSVVAGGAARFELIDEAQVLTLLRVLQVGQAALIDISRGVAASGDACRTRTQRQCARHQHRRIELQAHPEVSRLRAQIGGGDQPARSKLVLQGQVPRIHRGRLGVGLHRHKGAELDEWRVRAERSGKRVPARYRAPGVRKIERARGLHGVAKRWRRGRRRHDHDVGKIE